MAVNPDPPELVEVLRRLNGPLHPEPTGMASRGALKGPVRAVVFDIYGTLMISGSGDIGVAEAGRGEAAAHAALRAAGLLRQAPGPSWGVAEAFTDAIRRAHARALDEGVDYPEVEVREIWQEVVLDLVRQGRTREPDEAALERLAVEYESRTNPVWPMPGAETVIDRLAAAGLHLGVVSNAQFYTPLLFPALIGRSLAELGFDRDLCVWSWRLGRAKPSPLLFQALIAGLQARGIAPAETVYVGNDMLKDVWAARQAGCQTALYAGDRRSLRLRAEDGRCRGLVPDAVVTRLTELGPLAGAGA